ncbi:MAG: ATP-binding protein [Terracidiphilus sp.]|jgi:hypothetical protein
MAIKVITQSLTRSSVSRANSNPNRVKVQFLRVHLRVNNIGSESGAVCKLSLFGVNPLGRPLCGRELLPSLHLTIATLLRQATLAWSALNRFRGPGKRLENHDFQFDPNMNRNLIFELATAGWVERREDALFKGPPAIGRSHLWPTSGPAERSLGLRAD